MFLDALASLELDLPLTGSQIFREISVNKTFGHTDLQSYNRTTLQPYNLTPLQLYNFTTLQPYNLTTLQLFNLSTLKPYNFITLQLYNFTKRQKDKNIVVPVKYVITYATMRYCDSGVISHEIMNHENLLLSHRRNCYNSI